MKRSLKEFEEGQQNIADQYKEINELQKQLYLENQQRLKQKEIVIEDDDDNEININEQKIEQEVQLSFPIGTFCLNALTQYPKDERLPHILPFINILFENSQIDVKLEKPKKTLQSALMTCYGFEDELLEPIVKSGVNLFIINDNDNPNKKLEIIEQYKGFNNWTVIKPSKQGILPYPGSFHPKIWILKFPNFLRIVIGSQNLHVADWTVWSQAMWIQDFKLGKSELNQQSQEFKTMIKEFMFEILPTSHRFEELLKIRFDDYDFKDINIRLVTSLPGRYVGNQLFKYGMMRLQSIIYQELNNIKQEIPNSIIATYQTTSIGQLDSNFVDYILQCCRGKVYKQQLPSEQNNKKLTEMLFNQQEPEKSLLKVIYPTADYIENKTHGGVDFAHPLFMRKNQLDNPKFQKDIFYKYEGSEYYYWHTGNIPHLKLLIITNINGEINDNTIIYIGSHNLSQGAWGKMEKSGSQLYISNTELGVVYPPGKDTTNLKKQIIESLSFKYPPQKYEKDDKPWISEIYYDRIAMEQKK